MTVGQWERGRVVELCAFPLCRAMAGFAVGTKPDGDVIRVFRRLVIGQVTADTVRGFAGEDIVGMTGRAVDPPVPAGEREVGSVRELRVLPSAGGVTSLAVTAEACQRVIRIGRRRKKLLVTTGAGGRQTLKRPAGMAGVAGDTRMTSSQWE